MHKIGSHYILRGGVFSRNASSHTPVSYTHLDVYKRQGYGLGLSIVARVVQRLGWKLEIQSSQGTGTRVCITFMTPENSHSPRVHRSIAPGTPMYFGEKRGRHAWCFVRTLAMGWHCIASVSYTHLDVYKRQRPP